MSRESKDRYPAHDRTEQRMRDEAEKSQPVTGQIGKHDAGTAPAREDSDRRR
jgi:hypothetical protein